MQEVLTNKFVTHHPPTPRSHDAMSPVPTLSVPGLWEKAAVPMLKRHSQNSPPALHQEMAIWDTAVLRAATPPSHKQWIAKRNKGYWACKPTDFYRLHCIWVSLSVSLAMDGFWWPHVRTVPTFRKQHHLRHCFGAPRGPQHAPTRWVPLMLVESWTLHQLRLVLLPIF